VINQTNRTRRAQILVQNEMLCNGPRHVAVVVCAHRPYADRVVRAFSIVIALLAGCRQLAGLDDPLPNDGRIAGHDGDNAGPYCYGAGLVQVCFDSEPNGPLAIAQNIDTGALGCSTHVISGATGMCVFAGTTINIASGTQVLATGPTTSVPLVLVATDTMTIDGTLDASAHHNSSATPAGGNYGSCQAGTNPGSGSYGGGGQGGSFRDKGGDGGAGGSTSGGVAGAALATPTALHGGCSGRSGGNQGGSGGKGGGAMYLIAGTSITVTGRIDASGAGGSGEGDSNYCGGGAGGTGGMLGLDAPSVNVSGAVCAVGGGGAAGTTGNSGANGGDASGGTIACTPGAGATAEGGAGNGGTGGGASAASTGMSSGSGGGGGGGGSSGFIAIYGTLSGSGVVVPAP
jgi:hypothetical protein